MTVDVDLCSGAGGWAIGARLAGVDDPIGFEIDRDAVATHAAAGFPTVRASIHRYRVPKVRGVIASVPCQPFSKAGRMEGLGLLDHVLEFVHSCRDGWHEPEVEWRDDPRVGLVVEPLRWVLEGGASWCAWEQVPLVLPVWQACAEVLRSIGWSVWVGTLSAECYGVPQTRERAILIGSSTRSVAAPPASHQEYRHGEPRWDAPRGDLFGGERLPWVSMADALGWRAAPKLRARNDRPNVCERDLEEPAPTTAFGHAGPEWVLDPRAEWATSRPATTVTADQRLAPPCHHAAGEQLAGAVDPLVPAWPYARPATTVVGSFRPDVVAGPGWRGPGDGPRQNAPGAVKVTIEEALTLQSFPPDFPLVGSKTSRFRQVGNAIPPLLAAAVLREAAGVSAASGLRAA